MSYELITEHNASAYSQGREGRRIQKIVVHHWDDPANYGEALNNGSAFDSVVRFFDNGGNNTSAHYVAEAGRVAYVVDESDTAYHAGDWNENLISIGIECNPRCSEEDKQTIGELISDIIKEHGPLIIEGHRDVVSTACPGRYYPPGDVLGAYINGDHKAQAPRPVPVSPIAHPSVESLADAVLRGEYGNGEQRRRALGNMYDAVQEEINRRMAKIAPTPPIRQLAEEVIAGKYGDGEARRAALGENYDAVQAEVNEMLGAAEQSSSADIETLANEVIAGKYGVGDDRRNALGDNYDAVQARVNEMLGQGGGGVDLEALADDVIAGKYGNGDDRRNALGSNYDAVQEIVNRKLS